jgi:hypothetical protein
VAVSQRQQRTHWARSTGRGARVRVIWCRLGTTAAAAVGARRRRAASDSVVATRARCVSERCSTSTHSTNPTRRALPTPACSKRKSWTPEEVEALPERIQARVHHFGFELPNGDLAVMVRGKAPLLREGVGCCEAVPVARVRPWLFVSDGLSAVAATSAAAAAAGGAPPPYRRLPPRTPPPTARPLPRVQPWIKDYVTGVRDDIPWEDRPDNGACPPLRRQWRRLCLLAHRLPHRRLRSLSPARAPAPVLQASSSTTAATPTRGGRTTTAWWRAGPSPRAPRSHTTTARRTWRWRALTAVSVGVASRLQRRWW